MIRVHIICEGQTEETFIKEVLNDYLTPRDIYTSPALVGKPGHKGGNISFDRLKPDLCNRLLGDTNAYCTTFFDFYGLSNSFPGYAESASQSDISNKADIVQNALRDKLSPLVGDTALQRFIPYVQMYEFEALLFSDPASFARGIDNPSLETPLRSIRDEFNTPEAINDNPLTAPSKRILSLVPSYEKPILGTLAALEIGLPTILSECALFRRWIETIEGLAPL